MINTIELDYVETCGNGTICAPPGIGPERALWGSIRRRRDRRSPKDVGSSPRNPTAVRFNSTIPIPNRPIKKKYHRRKLITNLLQSDSTDLYLPIFLGNERLLFSVIRRIVPRRRC